eukprot:CAMPEP_0185175022 /NCGR_PEP_ID=MMETSP1139-20130426/26122_1 /TAXON_ID=298111 /ORGANISM="Pavlova sp., Strain CCMP459" /LENGTH=46 /DNA_ID= /DNA_START= /DNA_END= /DNA_ORIENTATION=
MTASRVLSGVFLARTSTNTSSPPDEVHSSTKLTINFVVLGLVPQTL